MLVSTKTKVRSEMSGRAKGKPAPATTTTTTTTTTSNAAGAGGKKLLSIHDDAKPTVFRMHSHFVDLTTLAPITAGHLEVQQETIASFEYFRKCLAEIQRLNMESARILALIKLKQEQMRRLQKEIVELEALQIEVQNKRKALLADAQKHFTQFHEYVEKSSQEMSGAEHSVGGMDEITLRNFKSFGVEVKEEELDPTKIKIENRVRWEAEALEVDIGDAMLQGDAQAIKKTVTTTSSSSTSSSSRTGADGRTTTTTSRTGPGGTTTTTTTTKKK